MAFNPNDLDYIMSADDIRAEEERDAELEAQYRDAVARYEDTYVETEHCTLECSEYGAVAHSAACREAFADSVREFNAIRAAERGEAPAAVDNTRAQREVFEPGLGWVRVPNADTQAILADAARIRAIRAELVAELAALPEVA